MNLPGRLLWIEQGIAQTGACVLLAAACATHAQESTPRDIARSLPMPAVSAESLGAWRAHIRPRGDEAAYEEIPWISTFPEGVRTAAAEGKPLLLWAMNGHPLGCT